jgi:hypothetical protein
MNQTTTWIGPYLIRLKRPVGQMPAGSVGTVVEHCADGKAAEVEFTTGTCFADHEHYTETVEFDDMEDAENGR